MSRRESWDWSTEQVYTPRGARPSVRLVPHHHRCPDGTLVVVEAQYVEIPNVTLYRWTVGGERARPTSAVGDRRDVAPDWSLVDQKYRAVA